MAEIICNLPTLQNSSVALFSPYLLTDPRAIILFESFQVSNRRTARGLVVRAEAYAKVDKKSYLESGEPLIQVSNPGLRQHSFSRKIGKILYIANTPKFYNMEDDTYCVSQSFIPYLFTEIFPKECKMTHHSSRTTYLVPK